MNEIINILFYVFFFGGLIGIVALWTQYEINQKKEKEADAQKPTNDDVA